MMTSPIIDDLFIHVFHEWLSVECSISFMQLFSVKSWLVFASFQFCCCQNGL